MPQPIPFPARDGARRISQIIAASLRSHARTIATAWLDGTGRALDDLDESQLGEYILASWRIKLAADAEDAARTDRERAAFAYFSGTDRGDPSYVLALAQIGATLRELRDELARTS